MNHCVFCCKFIKKRIGYKKPMAFSIYKTLPLKSRLEVCKNTVEPMSVLWCKDDLGPNYLFPRNCRFSDSCLDCRFFLISEYQEASDLPKWLIEREEEFSFPLTIVYCSKRKKSSQLIIHPLECEKFEKSHD